MIGARRTITRRVTETDLVTNLYPDFVKPPVLATARLVEWCERAAMEEMGECSLGTKMHVSYIAPADARGGDTGSTRGTAACPDGVPRSLSVDLCL